MKKILTIAATGIICVLAGATQTLAQPVQASSSVSGTVGSTCRFSGNSPGTLVLNPNGDKLGTDFAGGTKGNVSVVCSQGSSLKIGTATLTSAPGGANLTTLSAVFNGGSGFQNLAAPPSGDTISPVKTNVAGATANISTTVSATGGEFITPGSYVVNVPLTLTP
jgi:hypothetical protein